jgi:hypothetical protein
MMWFLVWCALFPGWLLVSKRLDPGSSKLARDDTVHRLVCFVLWSGWLFLKDWITVQARDDTVNSLVDLFSGAPFHHFTFPPFHDNIATTPMIPHIAIIRCHKRLSHHP